MPRACAHGILVTCAIIAARLFHFCLMGNGERVLLTSSKRHTGGKLTAEQAEQAAQQRKQLIDEAVKRIAEKQAQEQELERKQVGCAGAGVWW